MRCDATGPSTGYINVCIYTKCVKMRKKMKESYELVAGDGTGLCCFVDFSWMRISVAMTHE